jgi:putative copper export protein
VVRFSTVGVTAVALLAVTGTYRALAELGGLDDLTGTAYGQALLVKLGLFGLMLAVAGYNRLVLHPRLERAALGLDPDDRGSTGRLTVCVRGEMALAAGVLVMVGVLLATAPPA